MKILLIHNFYGSSAPSGEDLVFKNEVELLKKQGIEVVTYERYNDEIKDYGLWDKFLLSFENIWSRRTYRELKTLLKKEKPDIAHFHNIWYLISPSAYYACKAAGIPVVQTLHNFRYFCVNGLLMRDGNICEECISSKKGDRSWVMGDGNKDYGVRGRLKIRRARILKNAIRYGCYRESRAYSLPIAFMQYFHGIAGTWSDKVDAYISLTEFGKKKFIECGLPSERIFVKPNFLPDPPDPNYSHNGYGIFLGRISAEKGLSVLISAFQHLSTISYDPSAISHQPFKIKIVGDGPLRENLEKTTSDRKMNEIEFLGKKNFHECMELLQKSRFLVLPALCYENFPLVIREAYACGKPVIASRLGAMAELVEDGKTGLLFEPGNPEDLADKMHWMIEHETECIEMGKNARKEFEKKYTAEKNYDILMKIYNQVLGTRGSKQLETGTGKGKGKDKTAQ